MTQIDQLTHVMKDTLHNPYFGPSLFQLIDRVEVSYAFKKVKFFEHSIWEIVHHIIAELNYAILILEGDAPTWIEGETTWTTINDISAKTWENTINKLSTATNGLLNTIASMSDDILLQNPNSVKGPYYLMLHGTIQHYIYHSGQISLLISYFEKNSDKK